MAQGQEQGQQSMQAVSSEAAAGATAGGAGGLAPQDLQALWQQAQGWAQELGFSQIGVADVNLASAEPGMLAWLAAGFQGEMGYMAAHGLKRARPAELVPGTLRVITARMDYLPGLAAGGNADWQAIAFDRLADPAQAVISLYAQGRDYHKVLRQRLQQLAGRIQQLAEGMQQLAEGTQQLAAGTQQAVGRAAGSPLAGGYRVFTDSAPVLEVELGTRSGLGWRGKHTLLLSRDAGSMYFLGEIYTDLPLPLTPAASDHCGQCSACMAACPTGAIVAPYRLDARRCISYLTIEHDGAIPVEFRAAMGNRIYGCDDCQLACPWNKFAQRSPLPDFDTRDPLGSATLLQLWAWDEAAFLRRTEGSAIRRIGFKRWRRNLAVALGNAWRETAEPALAQALEAELPGATPLLAEHLHWALAQRAAVPSSSTRLPLV